MLKNAPLRLKLLLILLLPMLGFLTLAGVFVVDNYKTLRDMNTTVMASATAQKLSQLITTLQRERGASGVFLGSGGKSMGERMVQMRRDSSAAVEVVRGLSTSGGANLDNVLRALDQLPAMRGQVDKLSINSTESGARYTEIIQVLTGYTHSLEASVNNATIVYALGALNQFIEMKERAGRERVVLGLVFSQGHFDEALLSRFSRNLGEFGAYYDAFRRKAPAASLAQFDTQMQQPAAVEVGKLQRLAFEVPMGQALGIKPEAWFETSTQRIDLMSQVEEALGQSVSSLAMHERDDARRALWLTVGAVIVSLLAVAVLSWLIIRMIDSAVRDLNRVLNDLAERDLSARATYESKDEFGQISRNLNRMAQEISGVVQEIGNATAQVATAAEESSTVTMQTSQSVEQQRQSTELVATAINQMSATVREVAHSTNDAAQLSQRVNTSTTQGRTEIEGTITLIRQLSGQAEDTALIIGELKQESDGISSVLDVIRGIAEQTNLLALNAAIEAARAGDHGRGFAVVASEVRVLAQKTQESTGNIQQMISNLQSGSDRASSSMQETLGKAQDGARKVERAGELLLEIAEGVASISDRNLQIASAAEEQSAVSEDINRNVNEINDLVIQVSAGAEQTAITSQELARLAEHQQRLVNRFKVA
ncbi:methyl-accepting chemotaxis protein [Pseudomonas poae]|uniref:Methyl-accepting chemotaxis protein n=2 Tax=Pseudomonas TaxID=286 RepID=A0A7Z1K6R5_9PSED|nr:MULTISPECIES: methyl-accepting chemotaxis protein [Pseudomonas]KAA8551200.1 Methyl-accepting chemotaxis protein McpQ [Pseudomonas marginalis]NMZ94629.1 methyl-accepting chemotaxis protein [Pseudomonas marginalis]PFG72416.1 methyl-accepting chemotaxis protein [Pseudomonas poae]PUB40762.1 methyl-accepting chemotaxis protein [Pseudomonas sp. GV047]TWR68056.1 methyl-accepting chemotaxis protein [Pseudomonas marginalis]